MQKSTDKAVRPEQSSNHFIPVMIFLANTGISFGTHLARRLTIVAFTHPDIVRKPWRIFTSGFGKPEDENEH